MLITHLKLAAGRLERWLIQRRSRLASRTFQRQQLLPWQSGYSEYKAESISQSLADQSIMRRFQPVGELPAGYGIKIDERIVEFPWVVAHLPAEPIRCLDAGSTLNHDFILDRPVFANKDLTIMTLVPEGEAWWDRKIAYVWGDLRTSPFATNWFDAITCISTLEHVGMDNSIYTDNPTYQEKDFASHLDVIKEFQRILKPGGKLLLTVPYGKFQDCGFQQVFNADMLQRVIDIFGGKVVEKTFYQYSPNGWQLSDQAACAQCEYYDIHTAQGYDADQAAAARAVACLVLQA
ncbi:MAG: methyltransferase domain-containing protein [Candidatus Kerfeldbacteria bacterium]|nr:methyltransferase domain-containing protein [Candidatus Kerfeldbacteria bacterium]